MRNIDCKSNSIFIDSVIYLVFRIPYPVFICLSIMVHQIMQNNANNARKYAKISEIPTAIGHF